MGLITEEVEVNLCGSNIDYYEGLGYEIPRRKDKYNNLTTPINSKIEIKVFNLLNESHMKVLVKCDECNKEYELEWKTYLKQTTKHDNKLYCNNCKGTLYKISKENIQNKQSKYRDITGIKHGHLIPVTIDFDKIEQKKNNGEKYPPTYWLCKCDCGNEKLVSVRTGSLQSGATTSCGCVAYENITNIENLIGQKFNKLTVIKLDIDRINYEIKSGKRKKIYWLCECECGNTKSVWSSHLKRGEVTSCGCNISKGEKRVSACLLNKNILFNNQKMFTGLVGINSGNLSYDFYLPNQNLLIEYQGEQHEKYISGFHKNIEDFYKQIEHDKRKKEYAQNNNINLLEIWYWDFDNIENILDKYLKRGEFNYALSLG